MADKESNPHLKPDMDALTLSYVNFFSLDQVLASRYTSVLQTIFNVTNTRQDFMVDLRGMSPELKQQFGSYLTMEEINPYTIILSPDQEQAPIIDPRFSFDEQFMHQIYQEAAHVIHAVTPNEALWGEINNGIDVLTGIEDLLHLNQISIRLETPLGTVGNVKKLNEMHASLRSYIQDTAKVNEMIEMHKKLRLLKYGDMRGVELNGVFPLTMDVGSYSTKLFGGTYIIRDPKEGTYLLHSLGSSKKNFKVPKDVNTMRADDPALVDMFYEVGFITYSVTKESCTQATREIEDAVLLANGYDFYPQGVSQEIDQGKFELERKRGLMRYAPKLPAAWHELRDLQQAFSETGGRGATGARYAERISQVNLCSPDTKIKLAQAQKHDDVIRPLLSRLDRFNVNFRQRAALDADGLMKEFETFTVPKKKYVCYQLSTNGGESHD